MSETRFEREAKLLAALNHPAIATLYGFEDDFLVMEPRRRRDASGADCVRPDCHRRSATFVYPGRRGSGSRARERHRPSRPEAGKRHDHPGGEDQPKGFRRRDHHRYHRRRRQPRTRVATPPGDEARERSPRAFARYRRYAARLERCYRCTPSESTSQASWTLALRGCRRRRARRSSRLDTGTSQLFSKPADGTGTAERLDVFQDRRIVCAPSVCSTELGNDCAQPGL